MSNESQVHGTEIEKAGDGVLTWLSGPKQNSVTSVLPPEKATAQSLVFVTHAAQFDLAIKSAAPILIVHDGCLKEIASFPDHLLLFKTKNIPRSMANVLKLFEQKKSRYDWGIEIHPSAVIHPSAKLGKNVKIGPHAVIGAFAQVGDDCWIGATSVLEKSARLGQRTIIHPQVFVGADCEIGNDCEVHPHTTIGSDGFGFATDEKFKHHKIPQLGRVIIEDRVEIGANCAIDRATLTETRIRSGTKFDNLCHIAHNCEVGEDCLFAAGLFIAGSSKMGSRITCGGNVAITAHVKITDNVALAGRSTVTNHVDEPGQYGGYPLQPLKQALKTIASLGHISELRKSVTKILKHLELPDQK